LAGAWAHSRLDPLLVQAIGLHDNAWREADEAPRIDEATGLPYDFIDYPLDDKLAFYRRGIDQLEEVHPWVAHLISRHYTTFSGTREVDDLQRRENRRRARLEERISRRRLDDDDALGWVKFFDIFSLHLCLTGPSAVPDSIPRWLTDSKAWSTAPDGLDLTVEWRGDTTLLVSPWPFVDDEMALDLHFRELSERVDDQRRLVEAWEAAPRRRRRLTIASRSKRPSDAR
ncbi:MAG: DUF3891 family protein, partial [Persicimonas sp.]